MGEHKWTTPAVTYDGRDQTTIAPPLSATQRRTDKSRRRAIKAAVTAESSKTGGSGVTPATAAAAADVVSTTTTGRACCRCCGCPSTTVLLLLRYGCSNIPETRRTRAAASGYGIQARPGAFHESGARVFVDVGSFDSFSDRAATKCQ